MKREKHERIYLSSPHLTGEEYQYLQQALDSNWIAPLGPNVELFEKEVAEYVGTKGAVALSSGTAAIHLALKNLQIQKGDYVFCSTLTFIASANPILYEGGIPVFIDSEPESWNMSPSALEKALHYAKKNNMMPKAVIIVNLFGQIANMEKLIPLCNAYQIPVIEDAAESLGATYQNKKSGTFGEIGIFSFNGNKIITTSGGGMLVSNDEAILAYTRKLATQAREPAIHYEHTEIGYNYRMSNLLAGVGRAQLKKLDERAAQRRAVFERYKKTLQLIEGIQFMPEIEHGYSTRWLTACTIDETKTSFSAKDVIDKLNQYNIESRPVWKPLHLQPLFKNALYFSHYEQKSVSDELFAKGICLPSSSHLTIEQQNKVIEVILSMRKNK